MISPHLLSIDASYSYRTYMGCLESTPAAAIMIVSAKNKVEKLWGKRTTFVIDPPIKDKQLPTWTHIIWATGPAMSEDAHGSELIVVWFSELSPDTDRVLQAIDWEKHAKDFQI